MSVSCAFLVALSSLLLENNDVVSLRDFFNRCIDASIFNLRSSQSSVVFSSNHKNIIDADLSSRQLIQVFNHDSIIPQYLVLTPQNSDNCKHLVRMRWQSYSSGRVVHVYYAVLWDYWQSFRFSGLTFIPLDSFS